VTLCLRRDSRSEFQFAKEKSRDELHFVVRQVCFSDLFISTIFMLTLNLHHSIERVGSTHKRDRQPLGPLPFKGVLDKQKFQKTVQKVLSFSVFLKCVTIFLTCDRHSIRTSCTLVRTCVPSRNWKGVKCDQAGANSFFHAGSPSGIFCFPESFWSHFPKKASDSRPMTSMVRPSI
jgi:hypothetical protein